MADYYAPEGDVNKLAKWAQRYIEKLVRRIEDLERSVKQLSSEHPDTNVVIKGREHTDPDVTLPRDSIVYFYLGNENARDKLIHMVEVRHTENGKLYIGNYGSRGIIIRPSASNSFYIELEQR